MNNLLVQIYQSASSKYIKFRSRLDKNIANGRFKQFTRRKQSQLLSKVERLRRRVLQLQTQLKLASAGVALGLFLNTTPAQAQTSLGPYTRNYIDNPLPPPLPYINRPVPVYADLDDDGDLDLVVGTDEYYRIRYFENIREVGSTKNYFLERFQYDTDYPFGNLKSNIPSTKRSWVPAFADVDGDGDLDLLIGTDETKYGYSYGETFFFRNTGSATSPNFVSETGATNPFNGIQSKRNAHPIFVDLDKDGDTDLLVGGYYRSSTYNYLIQYFENTGTSTSPTFVSNTSISLVQRGVGTHLNYDQYAQHNPVAFADLDEDGDLDFFFTTSDPYSAAYGRIVYLKNNGGTFTGVEYDLSQTGPWVPASGLGNPFNAINQETPDNFKNYTSIAFADMDGDGDMDVTIGYDIYPYNYNSNNEGKSLIYYENTGKGVLQRKDGFSSPLDGIDVGDDSNVAFTDIDNDGDLDIIASGGSTYEECPDGCFFYYSSYVSVFENKNGVFSDITGSSKDKISNLNFDGKPKIKVIDLDRDNAPDLVVPVFHRDAYSYNRFSHVQYFKNTAGVYTELTGSQNPFDFINEPNERVDVDLGDLNGDGLLDLIVGVQNDRLYAYENTGTAQNPSFTAKAAWETGLMDTDFDQFNPKLIDLDNDGDLDIVVGKYRSIWYYENTGSRTAPDFVRYRSASQNPFKDIDTYPARNATPNFFDVDGDGGMDLIFGNGKGQFEYFENVDPIFNGGSELNVYNGFSPNKDDDKNPFFKIEFIETVSPTNTVTIYNRWGDVVFDVKNYDNSLADKRFEGVANNGKDLPGGIYFYKIETSGKTLTGYVSIKR